MKLALAGSALIFALTGCGTGTDGKQYYGRPGSPAWFKTASPNTIKKHFTDICTSYGFTEGSEAMASCMQKETLSQKQRNVERMAADPFEDSSFSCTSRQVFNSIYMDCD